MMLVMDDLGDAIAKASINRSRLIFLDSRSANELPSSIHELNLNKQLGQQLLDIPRSDRPKEVGQMLIGLINASPSSEVMLTGIEILFDRSLAIDPVRLLASSAKTNTLLAVWPGDKTSSGLSYAVPSHPEYRTYKTSDLGDVIFLTTHAQLH